MSNLTNLTSELTVATRSTVGIGAFGILLAIWIIFINGALIIGVFVRKSRRNDMFLLHIVNIAVADILLGILVLPITADFLLAGTWKLGVDVCQFWVISDILMCTVSILAIVMVSYDRFIYLLWPGFYRSGWKQYILGSVMILFPWIVGLGLVLPLWLNGQSREFYEYDSCAVVLLHDFHIISCFVSFFVPAFFAICMNIAVLIMMCFVRSQWEERSHLTNAKRPSRHVLTVALVSLVFIVMWCPFFVLHFLRGVGIELDVPLWAYELSMWLGYVNSGITPLLWLIYPMVRESYLDLVCCCRRKKNDKTDETGRSMIEAYHTAETEMRDM